MANQVNNSISYLRTAILDDIKTTLRERLSNFLGIACRAFKDLWELDGRKDPLPEHLQEDFLREESSKLVNNISKPGVYSSNGITIVIDHRGACLNFNCTYEIDFTDEVRGLVYLWMKESEELLSESRVDLLLKEPTKYE